MVKYCGRGNERLDAKHRLCKETLHVVIHPLIMYIPQKGLRNPRILKFRGINMLENSKKCLCSYSLIDF